MENERNGTRRVEARHDAGRDRAHREGTERRDEDRGHELDAGFRTSPLASAAHKDNSARGALPSAGDEVVGRFYLFDFMGISSPGSSCFAT